MKRSTITLVIASVALITGVGLQVISYWNKWDSVGTTPQDVSMSGPMRSANKVSFDVSQAPFERGEDIVVSLLIQPGWHVNATPASLDTLIPTTVSTTLGDQPMNIPTVYPPGEDSGVYLGDHLIKVYGDGAKIRLRPDDQTLQRMAKAKVLGIRVRVQACSDSGICLPPSDLDSTLAL